MTKQIEEPLVLNVKQVAKLLNCCESTVWKLRKAGKLRAIPLMSSVRFSREEVQRFVDGDTDDSSTSQA